MLITRLPDGSTLIELTGKQFADKYREAKPAEKVVLDDRRPAVRRESDLGVTYYTILGQLWEILRGLPRGQSKVQNRVIRCDACGTDMKLTREYAGNDKGPGCWCFRCPKCQSIEIWTKDIVGGTSHAGDSEKL